MDSNITVSGKPWTAQSGPLDLFGVTKQGCPVHAESSRVRFKHRLQRPPWHFPDTRHVTEEPPTTLSPGSHVSADFKAKADVRAMDQFTALPPWRQMRRVLTSKTSILTGSLCHAGS